MTQTIGRTPFFNADADFNVFASQLQQFFLANEITDDAKKKAILLTSLSEQAFKLLKSLISPLQMEAAATTYEACGHALKMHFKKPSAGFAERFKFYAATKSSAESVNDWAVRVRELAINCNFGDNLNEAMRDKFITGLDNKQIRDKLFLEPLSATFSSVLEVANNASYIQQQYGTVKEEPQLFYTANGTQQRFQKTRAQQRAQQQQRQQQPRQQQHEQRTTEWRSKPFVNDGKAKPQLQQQQCQVCGFNSHTTATCKFNNYKCDLCNKKGHLKKMCAQQRVNFMEKEDDLNLFAITGDNDGPICLKLFVSQVECNMQLDTGSEHNVISEMFFVTNFKNKCKLEPVNIGLKAYNGAKIQVLGSFEAEVVYNSKRERVKFMVIENGGPTLLGRNFLKMFKI